MTQDLLDRLIRIEEKLDLLLGRSAVVPVLGDELREHFGTYENRFVVVGFETIKEGGKDVYTVQASKPDGSRLSLRMSDILAGAGRSVESGMVRYTWGPRKP